MRLGFNHNVMYKGEIYHVQTEDSGLKNPHIITLLYRGGTILSSKKTSYNDILTFDNLDSLVDDMMKSQHKVMLRSLKSGAFDEKIEAVYPNAKTTAAVQNKVEEVQDTEGADTTVSVAENTDSLPVIDLAEFFAAAAPAQSPSSSENAEVEDIDNLISLLEVEVKKKETKSLDDAVMDFFSLK